MWYISLVLLFTIASCLSLSLSLMEYYASSSSLPPPPAPIIPSSQTAFATLITPPAPPSSHPGPSSSALSYPLPPVPLPGPLLTPPPPGPPPPPILPVPSHLVGREEGRSQESQTITDRRSDLLSAIRMGECALHWTANSEFKNSHSASRLYLKKNSHLYFWNLEFSSQIFPKNS